MNNISFWNLFLKLKGDKGIQGYTGEKGPTGDAGLDVRNNIFEMIILYKT